VTLRIVLLILAALLAVMAFAVVKSSMKNPIIVERACYSSPLETKSSEHTPVEIEAFVKESLRQRFDSDVTPNSEFLSVEEFKMRSIEQDELGRRQMRQRVILNSVIRKNDIVTVDADRLISVGSIRSAFPFPLRLFLSSVSRSESNPYGLVLLKITPNSEGETNEKRK
jgi:hypothetical protein